jgi:hypothetical protein
MKSWNGFYHSVKNLLSSNLLCKNIKIEFHKTTIFPVFCRDMMEDVRVKLNLGLPWRKLRSAGGRLSLPANWT